MKKKYTWWVFLLGWPLFVHSQNISNEFNSLLENIFTPEVAKPSLYVPQNPTASDLELVKQTLLQEYSALKEFDADIVRLQSQLYDLTAEKESLQKDLALLDVDLNIAKKKLSEYARLEQKWKKSYDQLEYNVSILRYKLQQEKKSFNLFLNKSFIQNESGKSGEDISLLDWLLSSKTVSQILEEKKRIRSYQTQKIAALKRQDQLARQLRKKESEAKKFFDTYARLKSDIQDQEKILSQLARAKAKKVQQVSADLVATQDSLSEKGFAQQRATEYLFSLQENAKQIEKKLQEKKQPTIEEALRQPVAETSVLDASTAAQVAKKVWEWPLKIPRKVTAGFQDAAYKKTLGRDHLGVDLLAPQGTPVYAPAAAVVRKVSTGGLDYAYVILEHEGEMYSLFGHLWKIFVKEGDVVQQNQRIALSGGAPGVEGSGPFTTGAHLHWEMFHDGKHVDPLTVVK